MAYTIQTIIMYSGLAIVSYSDQINANIPLNAQTKSAIGIIGFAVPPVLMLLSLLVFTKKYKLHGELADKVHEYIVNTHAKTEDTSDTLENK